MTANTTPETPSLFTLAELLAGTFTREFELLNGERVTVHLRFPPVAEAHTARREFGQRLDERVLFAAIHLSNTLIAPASGAAPASHDQLLSALGPEDLLAFEDLAIQIFFGVAGLNRKREECAKLNHLLAASASLPPDGTVTAATAANSLPQPPRAGAMPSRENPEHNMNQTPNPIPSEPSAPLPITTPESCAAASAADDMQAAYNLVADGLQRASAFLDRATDG